MEKIAAATAAAAAASKDLKLITRDSTEKVIFIIWNFFSLSDPRKALKVPIASRSLEQKIKFLPILTFFCFGTEFGINFFSKKDHSRLSINPIKFLIPNQRNWKRIRLEVKFQDLHCFAEVDVIK